MVGHCRRRKIRCILAPEDMDNRCQNCIRLKKECQFHPVDQQNITAARRGRSGSKAESALNEGEMSASSSEPGAFPVLKSSTNEQVEQANEPFMTSPSDDQSITSASQRSFYDYGSTPLSAHTEQAKDFRQAALLATSGPYHAQNFYSYQTQEAPPNAHLLSQPASYLPHRNNPDLGFLASEHRTDQPQLMRGPDHLYDHSSDYRGSPNHTTARRQSAPQQMSYGPQASSYSRSQGYGVQSAYPHYPDTSLQPSMDWMQQPSQSMQQIPPVTTSGYPQTWYAPPLSYLREEDDSVNQDLHGHLYDAYGSGYR
jgi:hypothetical protein